MTIQRLLKPWKFEDAFLPMWTLVESKHKVGWGEEDFK